MRSEFRPGSGRRRPARARAVTWLLLLALAPSAGRGDTSDAPLPMAWRRVALPSRGAPLTAAAVDPAGGRVAIGDRDGVMLGGAGEAFRRVARLGLVTDLEFDGEGALWIGTVDGLWRLGPDGRHRDRSPAAGEAGRLVRRVGAATGVRVLATEAGAFAAAGDGPWQAVGSGLAGLAIDALAVGPLAGAPRERPGAVAWLAAGQGLWRLALRPRDGGLAIDGRRLAPVPGRPLGEPPVDLLLLDASPVAGRAGSATNVALLYPRHLAVGRVAAVASDAAPVSSWRVRRLGLPPGARARRLARAFGRWWIVHDRGLVSAADPAGPWQRAAPPAGSRAASELAVGVDALWLAGPDGLLRGQRAESLAHGTAPSRAAVPPVGPDVRAVHAAALRYLDLHPEIVRGRFRGLARRGWIPSLSLRLAASDDRTRRWDDDQAFVSGETRFLRDRDGDDGREYEGSAVFTWEFGNLAYDSDWDDLSREARQVIALRDDVLDEINQLYFERRRTLASLAALEPGAAEATPLRLRASELAAGLDAWTGGWFSARLKDAVRPESSP